MKYGFSIIPAAFLVFLTAGMASATEPSSCPNPLLKPLRPFLQTDHLAISALTDTSGEVPAQGGYQLNKILIGSDPSSSAAPAANNSSVELAAEQDLAALRIKTEGNITPYVGAGISTGPEGEEAPGLSEYEAEREAERQEYLVGAGLDCELNHSTRLNLGYRYSTGNLPEFTSTGLSATEPENDDHHISFGLKLDF